MVAAWVGIGLLVLVAAATVMERALERRDARRYRAPGRLIDVGDGRTLHLMGEGDSGPVIVVEQGAGEPAILWRSLQQRAAAFSRFCLYDRAGYGWSPRGPGPRNVDERAEDLWRMLQGAGLPGPYILVAHSYGGLIVLAFARRFRNEVAGIVMVDAIDEGLAGDPVYLGFIRQGRLFVRLLRLAAAAGLIRLVGRIAGRDEAAADPEAERIAGAQAARPAFFRAIGEDLASLEDAAGRHRSSEGDLGDLPLVVLTHGKPFPGPFARIEPLWRPAQERIARLSSRGELIVAENSNHMIAADEPELVLESLAAMAAFVAPSGRALPAGPATDRGSNRGGAV